MPVAVTFGDDAPACSTFAVSYVGADFREHPARTTSTAASQTRICMGTNTYARERSKQAILASRLLSLVLTSFLAADEALAALDRKIASEPTSAQPRVDAAQARLQNGEQLDRALLDLDVARALVPEDPRIHFLFGQLMEERGQHKDARASYETALGLKDDFDDARFRLAGLLFNDGAFAEAAAAYARYVKGHPEATGARVQLAAALEKSGDVHAAEKELKALHGDPKTHELGGRKLLELYERHGREKDASKLRAAVEPPKRKLRDLKRSAR